MPNDRKKAEQVATRLEAAELSSNQGAFEAKELTETELKTLADQVEAEIETDEKKVLDTAAKEIEPSPTLYVDWAEAESTLASRGFAERIDAARRRIVLLATNAKVKVKAVLSDEQEVPGPVVTSIEKSPIVEIASDESSQTEKAEPIEVERIEESENMTTDSSGRGVAQGQAEMAREEPEGKLQETPPAITLESCIAARANEGIVDKIKDSIRLVGFKMQKVENPERVLGMIHYLEGNASASESYYDTIKESDVEKKTAALKKKGYEHVASSKHEKKEAKVRISAYKDVPYRFRDMDGERIAQVANSSRDPVVIFEQLRSLGYELNSYDVTLYGEDAKKFIEAPHISEFIEKLKSLQGIVDVRSLIGGSFFGGDRRSLGFANLAESDAKLNLLNEVAIKNLTEISSVLGMPLNGDGLTTWVEIAQDPATVELLKIIVSQKGSSNRISPYDLGGIARNIEALRREGVEDELVTLLKEGFSYDSFGLYRISYSYHRPEDWEEVIATIREFKNDPQYHKFVIDFAAATGSKLTVRPDELTRIRELYRVPGVMQAIKTLKGEFQKALTDPETAAIFADPEFEGFLVRLREAGYVIKYEDFFAGYQNRNLFKSFRSEEFRAALATPDGAAVAKQLNLFARGVGYDHLFFRIMKTSEPLQAVEKLEQEFGYRPGDASYDAESLCRLLEDQDAMDKLLDPETVAFAKKLKEEFGVSFKIQDAARLVELKDDSALQEKLSDPTCVSFIKKTGVDLSVFNIAAFANFRPELRPLAESLADNFGYRLFASWEGSVTDEFNLYALQHERPDMIASLLDPAKLDATKKVFADWNSDVFNLSYVPAALRARDEPALSEAADRLMDAGVRMKSLSQIPDLEKIIKYQLVPVFERFKDSQKTREFLLKNIDRVGAIPQEKIPTYVEIFHKIDESPSQEVQRLKDQLLSQLLESNRPIEDYQEIEAIFIKNNVPTVGKVFGVFEALYNHDRLGKVIDGHKKTVSPVLKHASVRRRDYVIYQDLVDIHISSGNRSLKEYVEVLQSGSDVLDRYERSGIEALAPREQEQLRYFIGKLETLLAKSALDTADDAFQAVDIADIGERVNRVREGLKVKEGQTVLERVSEMYLRPAGVESLDEILEKMHAAKLGADSRGRAMVAEAAQKSGDGTATLALAAGDFLKGTDVQYIANIFQNGSVAKEFLGASSGSDSTPLDTDISLVLPDDLERGTASAIEVSIAKGYGQLLFALKDHGKFQRTKYGSTATSEPGKRELFQTGVAGERHYGIRTGFATTEIDFMVAQDGLVANERDLEKVYFEIAQNGFYIPVADTTGRVIFTPEMYHERRKAFSGLKKFDGETLVVDPTTPDERSYAKVTEIAKTLPEDSERVNEAGRNIRNEVERALGSLGVSLRPEFDTSILGAELLDTGSTGRHTNMPGDFDFDLSLKLDANDFPKARQLAEAIKAIMKIGQDDSHEDKGGYYQLRAKGVTAIGDWHPEKPIDIDIGFAKKSDLSVYGSHDAVRDKLNFIKQNGGEEVYEQAVANIVLTKQILKDGHAYKKLEHGGIGGIGVENWILANGGNMEEAFRSFRDAAYENGARLPFEEFKKRYRILDAGVNVKYLSHDNFINILKPEGYEAMLNTIDGYLGK